MSNSLTRVQQGLRPTAYDGYRSFGYYDRSEDLDGPFVLAPEFDRVPAYDLGLTDEEVSRTQRLMNDNPVISLHDHPQQNPADMSEMKPYIRTGRQETAYAALARSGLSAVFDNQMAGTSCVTSQAGWKWDDTIYDLGLRLCDLAKQDYVTLALSVDDILDAYAGGRLAMVFGLEAATPIENEVDRLDILYGFGIRQCGIAFSESNTLGGGLKEQADGGLTAFGRRCVKRMNDLGIAIDVSHSGDRTCMDTFELSDKPVLITHAGAREVWPTPRMKPDEVLKRCAETGGVIGLEAAPHTTISRDHPRHSIESVMDHFRYCVDLVGIEHVAFGPDTHYGDHVKLHEVFARNIGVHTATDLPPHERVEYVDGLENPTESFINIVGWLVKNGYSDEEIIAVTSGNILRVLGEVW
jgi:membrane dipeptidase